MWRGPGQQETAQRLYFHRHTRRGLLSGQMQETPEKKSECTCRNAAPRPHPISEPEHTAEAHAERVGVGSAEKPYVAHSRSHADPAQRDRCTTVQRERS